jgi:hypothetical protein
MVMNLRVSQNVGKYLSSCASGGFSRMGQLHIVRKYAQYNIGINMSMRMRWAGRVAGMGDK